MLHIINKTTLPEHFIDYILPGHTLLFIEDGVYLVTRHSPLLSPLQDSHRKLYALKSDIEARGLIKQISPLVNICTYEDFVGLVTRTPSSMSW